MSNVWTNKTANIQFPQSMPTRDIDIPKHNDFCFHHLLAQQQQQPRQYQSVLFYVYAVYAQNEWSHEFPVWCFHFSLSHHWRDRKTSRDLYIQFLFGVLSCAFKMGFHNFITKRESDVFSLIHFQKITQCANSQFNKFDMKTDNVCNVYSTECGLRLRREKGVKRKLYTRNCKVNRNGEDDVMDHIILLSICVVCVCVVCDLIVCVHIYIYQTNGLCTCFVLTPEIFAHTTGRHTHSHIHSLSWRTLDNMRWRETEAVWGLSHTQYNRLKLHNSSCHHKTLLPSSPFLHNFYLSISLSLLYTHTHANTNNFWVSFVNECIILVIHSVSFSCNWMLDEMRDNKCIFIHVTFIPI